MNRISIVLNILLTIAVIILFYMVIDLKNNQSTVPAVLTMKPNSGNTSVVYVNIDTLINQYEYVKEARKQLETESAKKQKELEGQYQSLERKANEFKEIAARLSPEEGQRQQNDLMQKEQQLMQLRDNLNQELMNKEQEINAQLQKAINEYLVKYKAQMPYNYVLSYTSGGGILFANDSLEITKALVKGLNEEYKEKVKN